MFKTIKIIVHIPNKSEVGHMTDYAICGELIKYIDRPMSNVEPILIDIFETDILELARINISINDQLLEMAEREREQDG